MAKKKQRRASVKGKKVLRGTVVGIAVLMPHTIRDQLPVPAILSKKVTVADAALYLRISA